MSSVFYLPNQSSQTLLTCELEELATRPSIHHQFPTKDLLKEHNRHPDTEHVFYSLVEPAAPARRISAKDNPAARFHGLVADFDAKISDEMLSAAVARFPADYKPCYTTKTYSGGCRIIWTFATPLAVISTDLAKELLRKLAKDMKLTSYLPGFDEGAWMDPSKPYELGANWVAVNPGATVPQNLLTKILMDACKKVNWSKQGGPSIPIDDVAAEVERRWPNRWQGPFAVGAQGIRFWDPKADNLHGCWIRKNGVVAFTGENKFMHWEEVLGKEFVKKYEANRIGGAIADCYYDGKRYWLKDHRGHWQSSITDVLRRHLQTKGLSAESRKGAMSEVDRALAFIESTARVDGASPFLFHEKEIVEFGAGRYLNMSRVRAMPPADGTREWGQEFPWIAGFLRNGFRGEQLDAFLSWHYLFWYNSWKMRPCKGHALFIGGHQNAGKTLLSYRILGASVGGFTDSTKFLLGQTEFNSELLEVALGCVDDAVGTANRRDHDVYTQMVKKMVANPSLVYRKMYMNPVLMPYFGRIVVTFNLDAKSLEMVPSSDGSIIDKLVFLQMYTSEVAIPANVEAIIARELPAYLAFLRDYKIPASMQGDPRFGMRAYKDPILVEEARANSASAECADVIDMWKTSYFRQIDNPWEGSASQLLEDLFNTDTVKTSAKVTVRNPRYLGRMLAELARDPKSGVTTIGRSAHQSQRYKITRNAV